MQDLVAHLSKAYHQLENTSSQIVLCLVLCLAIAVMLKFKGKSGCTGNRPANRPTLKVKIVERILVDPFTASEWRHLPAWSKDGSRVALICRAQGDLRLGIVPFAELIQSGTEKALPLNEDGASIGGMCWHPDGSRLLTDHCYDKKQWSTTDL